MEEDGSSPSAQADASPWSAHELEITTPAHKYLASSGEEGDDKFKNVAPPLPRYGHSSSAVASPAGDVLIFGGRVDDQVKNDTWAIRLSEDSGPSDNVIRRKVTANLMDTTSEAPSARSEHASALVDKWLVVWGGCFGFLQFADDCVYLLDTTTNIWTKLVLQPAPPVRNGHAACACGNKFVMFGGYGGRSGYFNDIWTIDLDSLAQRTPKWEQIKVARGSESPSGRAGHSMVAHKNKLHVFGGDQYRDTVACK
ncbi:Tip elongation aberrant protein 1 AltName: Full=Altered polarity protein 8 [Rhizoctonia solani AG-1 IB]|uniref:Rhizoctonia solani AG1-IB WGS project CAOJ00000000 data, isolate 7/3/14, contig 21428 n=1 Tax=Thanatephorus cucumeris (strain AG1-IB / isolate 7/3/14) TaxID=1108050 RepID=M5C756_THACB|nr:Tip elongation aberrant protein 1 AltName: Full=Altered polarity protein 8 [Rhizoctonia solani AG-1 IB]